MHSGKLMADTIIHAGSTHNFRGFAARPPRAGRLFSLRCAVPYGLAISFGAWAAFFHTGFLDHRIDEVIKIIH